MASSKVPLNRANYPFNPVSRHTTNNFNVLMAIDMPACYPFLYF